MARIVGVDLPNKAVKIALTYIYGIGRKSAMDICQKTNINPDVRINTLSSEEIATLRNVLENEYKIEGHLRTEVALNIKISAATEVFATERIFQSEVRGPRLMPAQERVRRRQSLERRNKGN